MEEDKGKVMPSEEIKEGGGDIRENPDSDTKSVESESVESDKELDNE